MACKVCGENHTHVCEKIIELGFEIKKENGERLEKLRAKCKWEQRSVGAILLEYGDPKDW